MKGCRKSGPSPGEVSRSRGGASHGARGAGSVVAGVPGAGVVVVVVAAAVGLAVAVAGGAARLAASPAVGQEAPAPPPAADTVPGDTVSGDTIPERPRYRLQGLTVETTRPTITGGGASGVGLSVDSVSVGPSPMLSEVLAHMPLIRVRRNSRGQVQPTIRGMEERQIAVLVDQVPLTLGWDNRSDLSIIPLTAANRVELIRGLSSVLAGPNVLGGLIKVAVSHGPFPDTVERPLTGRLGLDHTGAYAVSAEARRLWHRDGGRFYLRAGGGFRDSPGASVPGGVSEAARGEDGRLLNTDFRYVNGYLSGRYQAEGGEWLSVSSMAYQAERGVMPELHLLGGGEPAPRFWRYPDHWRWTTALSGGTAWGETPLGEGDLEASVGLDFQHVEVDDYEGIAYRDSVGGETGDERILSFRMVGDHSLGPGTLSGAFTFAETRRERTLPGAEDVFRQRLWSAGLEVDEPLEMDDPADGFFVDPRLTVGFSLDGVAYPETGAFPARDPIHGWGTRVSGRTGLGGRQVELHGGVSRKVRFPALRELFSDALGKFLPNPELQPLTLKVGEVGATWHLPSAELQAMVFRQRLEGAVVRAVVEGGQFQRQNRGETRASGVELVASVRLGEATVRGDLTLQDVTLRDEAGDPTGEKPEYQPELDVGVDARVPLGTGLAAEAAVEHLGGQWGVNPQLGHAVELDPLTYVEAGLSRRFGAGLFGLPRFRASARVENLTDAVIYDQLGLPRPGRTFRLQLEFF